MEYFPRARWAALASILVLTFLSGGWLLRPRPSATGGVYEQARLAVRFARKFTDDVEFSPEDGSRSDIDFLCRVLEAVINEGARTIAGCACRR